MKIQGYRIAYTIYFPDYDNKFYCRKCEKYVETEKYEKYVFLPPERAPVNILVYFLPVIFLLFFLKL